MLKYLHCRWQEMPDIFNANTLEVNEAKKGVTLCIEYLLLTMKIWGIQHKDPLAFLVSKTTLDVLQIPACFICYTFNL